MASRSCPTCHGMVEPVVGSGRPRIYCSAACRREMVRLRRGVGDLEAALADARLKSWGFWPGKDYWREAITHLNRELDAARRRVPSE